MPRIELGPREEVKVPRGVFQVYVVEGRVEICVDGRPVEFLLPRYLSKVHVSDGESVSIRNILAVKAEVILLM